MGRVHQPLLLVATFVLVFSTLIECRKTSLEKFELQKVQPEFEVIEGRYVNSVYNHDSGTGFRDKGGATDGRVNGEEPALFLLHFLPGLGLPFPFPFPNPFRGFGFPFPFGFPLPLPFPNPFRGRGFPFPFPFPFRGLWPGGFPGGIGRNWGRGGWFPGGPGGFPAKHQAEGKEEFRSNPFP